MSNILDMHLQGFVSNADYSSKKTVLVLFINGRPVDCSPLKRAIEATYAAILPKAAKPWIFLVSHTTTQNKLQATFTSGGQCKASS